MADYENFDSVAFMEEYYSDAVVLDLLRKLFIRYGQTFHAGALPGNRLLDFGCGPTLAYVLGVGDNFTDIVMADYAEPNIKLLQKWKETGEYPFDWSSYYDLIIQSSSKSELQERYETRLEKLRSSIKEILFCDANKSDPITPSYRGNFDAIISSFAIESAATTVDQYKKCIRNAMTLLKSGGKLIMAVAGKATFWEVRGEKYHCLPVDEKLVCEALAEAGMIDVTAEVTNMAEVKGDFQDTKYYMIITATKL